MKRRVALPIAFLLAAGIVSSAHAQSAEDDSGLRMNCAGDYFRFCTAYQPGSVAIKQCFGRNFASLQPACQGAIRAFDKRAGRRSPG